MKLKKRKDKRADWHRYFAWHPVLIEGEHYWMQMVERKVTYNYSLCHYGIDDSPLRETYYRLL